MEAEQLKVMFEQQLQLIKVRPERLSTTSLASPAASRVPQSVDGIAGSINEFRYEHSSGITSDAWFRRYEDLFRVDFSLQDDKHDKYANYILLKNPRDFTFDETVNTLSQIFGEQTSLFNIRYRCMKLVKIDADDFLTYSGIVNRECERFKLGSLTEDQFKSLIFICGLQSPKDAEIRTRLLSRIEQDPSMTLQAVTSECQRLLNLKHDTAMVQLGGHGGPEVHAIHQDTQQPGPVKSGPTKPISQCSGPKQNKGSKKKPPSQCWHCGAWHFVRFCPYKKHRCRQCKSVGHKDGYCQSRMHTASAVSKQSSRIRPKPKSNPVGSSLSLLATFQINTPGNRKYLTVTVNGHPIRLQLDTASDITIISERLWRTLGQPPIRQAARTATSACGGELKLSGELQCCVSFRGTTFVGSCYITATELNLLGLDWFDRLGLADIPISAVCNAVQSPTAHPDHASDIMERFPIVFQSGLEILDAPLATGIRETPGHDWLLGPDLVLMPDWQASRILGQSCMGRTSRP
ncbi:hypothetical protein T265_00942 [Opisthorchis viverrini]|uniref:Peptidase A2 domain-containing protein n=1 Tax=Opisthorchis viverrini TaxID=6198 RepID=A0A075A0Y4_OPIVI|nr:hypothetical protein T265_00942 [Opisthorchis viverrini]KER33031.1 hypothetical protein T265_00942 [Opisthorchis viverrini]